MYAQFLLLKPSLPLSEFLISTNASTMVRSTYGILPRPRSTSDAQIVPKLLPVDSQEERTPLSSRPSITAHQLATMSTNCPSNGITASHSHSALLRICRYIMDISLHNVQAINYKAKVVFRIYLIQVQRGLRNQRKVSQSRARAANNCHPPRSAPSLVWLDISGVSVLRGQFATPSCVCFIDYW